MPKKAIILSQSEYPYKSPAEERLTGKAYVDRLNRIEKDYIDYMINYCERRGLSVTEIINVQDSYDGDAVKELADNLKNRQEKISVILGFLMTGEQYAEIKANLRTYAEIGLIEVYFYLPPIDHENYLDKEGALVRLDEFPEINDSGAEEPCDMLLLHCTDYLNSDTYYRNTMGSIIDSIKTGKEVVSVDTGYLYRSGYFVSLVIIGSLYRSGLVKIVSGTDDNTPEKSAEIPEPYSDHISDPIGSAFKALKKKFCGKPAVILSYPNLLLGDRENREDIIDLSTVDYFKERILSVKTVNAESALDDRALKDLHGIVKYQKDTVLFVDKSILTEYEYAGVLAGLINLCKRKLISVIYFYSKNRRGRNVFYHFDVSRKNTKILLGMAERNNKLWGYSSRNVLQ